VKIEIDRCINITYKNANINTFIEIVRNNCLKTEDRTDGRITTYHNQSLSFLDVLNPQKVLSGLKRKEVLYRTKLLLSLLRFYCVFCTSFTEQNAMNRRNDLHSYITNYQKHMYMSAQHNYQQNKLYLLPNHFYK
jgi:hypothetical protein